MMFYLFIEKKRYIMNRHSKNRHHGDPVQVPDNLADQINQDRNVTSKKNRQKQKRKYEDEEEDEQVCLKKISFKKIYIEFFFKIIDERLSRKIIQQAREQQNEFDN